MLSEQQHTSFQETKKMSAGCWVVAGWQLTQQPAQQAVYVLHVTPQKQEMRLRWGWECYPPSARRERPSLTMNLTCLLGTKELLGVHCGRVEVECLLCRAMLISSQPWFESWIERYFAACLRPSLSHYFMTIKDHQGSEIRVSLWLRYCEEKWCLEFGN